MTAYRPDTNADIARRVVRDIPAGACVNLGIGMPMVIADVIPADNELMLHSENGILGMGPAPAADRIDPDLINAGKQPVTLMPGASIFDHALSFAMIRGGHIDICVLGAFQVSAGGDLANWRTPEPDAVPSVGGAMDLATGARRVFVMMGHLTRDGRSKIVERCTYPLTGVGVVERIYTDLATLQVTDRGLVVLERVQGLCHAELERVTGLALLGVAQNPL